MVEHGGLMAVAQADGGGERGAVVGVEAGPLAGAADGDVEAI